MHLKYTKEILKNSNKMEVRGNFSFYPLQYLYRWFGIVGCILKDLKSQNCNIIWVYSIQNDSTEHIKWIKKTAALKVAGEIYEKLISSGGLDWMEDFIMFFTNLSAWLWGQQFF